MKKILVVLLSVVLAAFTFGGCKTNKVDNTRTQLYVGVYDGGIGSDSVYALAKRFESKYSQYSFEPGKKGVQVLVNPSRNYAPPMVNTIKDMNEEVFIGTSASANFLAKKGLLLDISDVYSTPMNQDMVTGEIIDGVESSTLKDKIRPDLKYHFMDDATQKYYGFAGSTTFYGIVYDIDLFEEENLFFNEAGTGFVTKQTDARSSGADGKAETTYDNGLPATYDQFFMLCDRIVEKQMTPIMWGGNVQEYMSSLLRALAVDNDGKAEAELNYGFDGTSNTLVSGIGSDGSLTIGSPEKITAKNGYKLYKQEGRMRALSWLEKLISNKKYYNDDATNTTLLHTTAQEEFLFGKRNISSRARTAMLVDGNWWQSEARGAFSDMDAAYGSEDSMYSRRFGMMPLPKATAQKVGEDFTVLEIAVGDSFINGNIKEFKQKLAKSFVHFMHTDQSLLEYIEINGICMPYTVDAGERYSNFTPWGKSMYDLSENAVIATQNSKSKIMMNYSSDLWYSPELWKSKQGKTYIYPTLAMIDDKLSAKQYFDGMTAYWTESTWQNAFKDV